MDRRLDPQNVAFFLPSLVLLLHNVVENMFRPGDAIPPDEGDPAVDVAQVHDTLVNMNSIVASVLHDFRIAHATTLLDQELGWWVLPRSTSWFSRFVLQEYDDSRWLENFRMSKSAVFSLTNLLRPHIEKQNTTYRMAIPPIVRVACTLFKLCQGASLLLCSEFFAIGTSTASGIIRDVVKAINDELRHEISWPTGERLQLIMNQFREFSGLPGVVGAIDGTHFHIRKPNHSPEDYFYFKSGGYTMQCQAVVDRSRKFIDLSVGMPGSTNDARQLRRRMLYQRATTTNLFNPADAVEGFIPYLIGDKGYPVLPWLITPYRELGGRRSVQETLFNRKLSRARSVVENAFGILKQSFRELHSATDLHVTLLPDVVVTCCILHNMLLGQSAEEVEALLAMLQREGMAPAVDDDPLEEAAPGGEDAPLRDEEDGEDKRRNLSAFLVQERN